MPFGKAVSTFPDRRSCSSRETGGSFTPSLNPREVPLRTQFALAFVAALAAVSFAAPGHAADTAQQANMKSCAATWNGMAASAKSKTTY